MNDNIRIIIDGGEMFDSNIVQFEDCFGGVGGTIGGVVRFCGDRGYDLETEENGIRTGYIITLYPVEMCGTVPLKSRRKNNGCSIHWMERLMRTVLHLIDKSEALVLEGDDRVVTAVSPLDVLRGDKPYRKFAREVKRESSFELWNDTLMSLVSLQEPLFIKTMSSWKVFHHTRHPMGFMVGDCIKLFGWNAIITDYVESPVSDYYGFWVMAAKNITRQQHRGELWADAMEHISPSTREDFVSEYKDLIRQQDSNIAEVLRMSDR